MTRSVQPFRPELDELTRKARDKLAEVAFKDVTVKGLLSVAAKEGRYVCVIPAPLDLSDTEAAKAIVRWCAKEGLSASWSPRAAAEPHAEAPKDLVVSWARSTC